MTLRLYYTDPACRRFDATVTRAFEREGRPAVVLDRTAFYPTSGGQPFDTGRLGDSHVLETIDAGDEIVHIVSRPLAAGARVIGEIDWQRRFDHMQQHTGQHVLSAAFDRLFGNPTASVHFGAEVSTIDLAREASPAERDRAVDEANRVVWENRSVSIRFLSDDDAARVMLRKEPVRQGTLRIIEIDDVDRSACGGTHVARTGEVGLIAVIGAERVRGGTRLTFVCGGRALRVLRTCHDAVTGAVRVLSVLPEALPGAVERLQADARDLKKTVARLHGALAAHEAARLLRDAPEVKGARLVVQVLDGWDPAALKGIAAAVCASEHVRCALFSTPVPMAAVVATSAGDTVDAGAVLRALTERFGGRGGGKPDLAQGGGLTGDPADIAATARGLLGS